MGIHYPSDNEAARQVAYRMLHFYFANETFQKDLSAAKKEWQNQGKSWGH